MATRSILVVLAAFALASCGQGAAEDNPPPSQEVSFRFVDDPASPVLTRWQNGLIHVSCPVGYHFDEAWRVGYDNQEIMECEPNPAPGDNE